MEPGKKAIAGVAGIGCLSIILNLALYAGIVYILYLVGCALIKYIGN